MIRINKFDIYGGLDLLFKDAKCELNYSKDYELLLSVMLSAQTTDKRVNEVTKELYKKYDTLDKLNNLSVKEIERYIKPLGFYKTKSLNFKKIVEELNKIKYVPNNREYLENLPGVGRKTASVVLGILFDEPSFAVDTHVYRVAKRLSITNEKDNILETEMKLKSFFDKDKWNKVNSAMVLFGRYVCTARNPKCLECPFKGKCKYYNNIINNKK